MAQAGHDTEETITGGPTPETHRGPWSEGALIAGRYRLDRMLGEGGMGVVWAATHSITRRRVALKFLTNDGQSPRARKRFLREARAASAVRHPNVIDIYDVLELEDGAPVIVMELLPGESLARRLRLGKRLPVRQAASILLQVVAAVGEAHALGIIHRDLKPENIFLLAGQGERVKVLDFGIAKLTAPEGVAAQSVALTQPGAILGTLCYMAPEQANGEREIDHRADIWALGLVLYECLSGVLPTEGDNIVQILTLITTGTIPPLATRAPEVPAEVSGLVDRMLARQRDARPADLRPVAEILARYAGTPAPSIGPPLAPRVIRSDPAPAPEERKVIHDGEAADPLAETEKIAGAAPGDPLSTTSDAAVTRPLARTGQGVLGRDFTRPSLRDAALQDLEAIEPMVASISACFALAFRPDGALLATAHDNGLVYLWDTATGTALRALRGHTGCVHSMAISPDGELLVTGSADTTLRVWHIPTGRSNAVFQGHTNAVRSVAISPDGRTIVSASSASVRLWAITGGPAIRVIKEPKALLRSVAIRPDGQIIATGAPHGVISLWEAATGKLLAAWRAIRAPLRALAYHPNGQILASCGDNAVRLWGADSGHVLQVLEGHTAPVRCIAFSPDGETLVSGSEDRTLRCWDTATGELVRVLEGHASAVHSVAFRPDGQMLASGGDDRALTLWELPGGRARSTPRAQPVRVHSVALSPDGHTIASGLEDGSIALWKFNTGQLQRVFKGPLGVSRSLAFSPDGQTLAAATGDQTITLYTLSTGQVQRTFTRSSGSVRSLVFSPDGQSLAAGADDATIALWEVMSGREPYVLKGNAGPVRSLVFSPDGQTLAAGAEDRTLQLFSLSTAEARLTVRSPSIVHGLAYHRDGSTLHAFAEDGSLTVWETTRGQVVQALSGQAPPRVSAAFSADLRWLVSAGRDGLIQIADATSGAHHAALLKLADGWAAFTPDGRYKLKGRVDGVFWHAIGLYRFEPGELDQHLPAPLRLPEDAPLLP